MKRMHDILAEHRVKGNVKMKQQVKALEYGLGMLRGLAK